MSYPEDCNTSRKRTEYLYRVQELLRRVHNGFSRWLHVGLTQNQYDQMPNRFKNKYPYVPQLSKKAWDQFVREDFTPRSNKICQEICVQRAELKKSTEWSIDIGEI